jgi:hypothetical protein
VLDVGTSEFRPLALVHVEPIRFFSPWLTGLLFAEVFERRRTLVANMCAHATLNLRYPWPCAIARDA